MSFKNQNNMEKNIYIAEIIKKLKKYPDKNFNNVNNIKKPDPIKKLEIVNNQTKKPDPLKKLEILSNQTKKPNPIKKLEIASNQKLDSIKKPVIKDQSNSSSQSIANNFNTLDELLLKIKKIKPNQNNLKNRYEIKYTNNIIYNYDDITYDSSNLTTSSFEDEYDSDI